MLSSSTSTVLGTTCEGQKKKLKNYRKLACLDFKVNDCIL
jgi:hypothetical protein